MGSQEHSSNGARRAAVLDALRRYEIAAAGFEFHHSRHGWDEATRGYHDQICAISDELFASGALNRDYHQIYRFTPQERAELASVYRNEKARLEAQAAVPVARPPLAA